MMCFIAFNKTSPPAIKYVMKKSIIFDYPNGFKITIPMYNITVIAIFTYWIVKFSSS